MRRVWLIAILWLIAPRAGADIVFQTGFEPSDGINAGPIGGQQSWIGDATQPADSAVEFSESLGSNVLRIASDGGFDGFFHLGASTPDFDIGTEATTIVSQVVMINATGEADFLLQTVDADTNTPAVQLQFAFGGDLIVNGADTGFNWSPLQPLAVTITHDHGSETAAVEINGSPVAVGIGIAGVDRFDRVEFGTDDAIDQQSASFFVDNIVVSAIPEPTALLLTMVGACSIVAGGRSGRSKCKQRRA